MNDKTSRASRRAAKKEADEKRRAAMPAQRPKMSAAALAVTLIAALLLTAGAVFVIWRVTHRDKSPDYSSAKSAAEAYFESIRTRDSDMQLGCFPPEVRDYFVEQEGGRERYDESFAALCNVCEGMQVAFGETSAAGQASVDGVERFRRQIGATFSVDQVAHVAFTYTMPDGTVFNQGLFEPGDGSGCYVTCVLSDGRWYVFTD